MKHVEFAVVFSADVPDDADLDTLYLNIPIDQVQVSSGSNRELLAGAKVHEFEPIDVRDPNEDEDE